MDECSLQGWNNAMSTITLKGIIDEDFVNYRVPSMLLIFPKCSFKCDVENQQPLCQNSNLVTEPDINISIHKLCERYVSNPITKAIVCQGLEPFDSFNELCDFISCLRFQYNCYVPIVIYTGYNKEEIKMQIQALKFYPNIIIKYGRFKPNQKPHYDEVLGINLTSDNQYAERIS